ncbi:hypothetical protein R3P38DRAFT_3466242 [Favolaschia claudopus]|uniref:Uncharacterized protein n=1 Tax=Favolaschia claudopus TaxID=2862362 RepID=A0AAV9ZF66_9AGAR
MRAGMGSQTGDARPRAEREGACADLALAAYTKLDVRREDRIDVFFLAAFESLEGGAAAVAVAGERRCAGGRRCAGEEGRVEQEVEGGEEKGKSQSQSQDLDHIVKSTPTLSSVPADAQATLTSSSTTATISFSSQRTSNPSPPAFTSSPSSSSTTTATKTFHRRSSSDIISTAPKLTWADDTFAANDPYRDSVLANDLAATLGGGIALVSVGLDDEEGAVSVGVRGTREAAAEEEEGEGHEKEGRDGGDVVLPIVIKQRSPSPAFSVTSRPAGEGRRSIWAWLELGGGSGTGGNMVLQTWERSGSTVVQAASSSSSTVAGTFLRLERSEASTGSFSTSTAGSMPSSPASSSSKPPTNVHVANPSPTPISLLRRCVPSRALAPYLLACQSLPQTSTPPPPHRPLVPSGGLSPTSSTGESSRDPALLTPWDWSDTGGSSGEERGRWRGGLGNEDPEGANTMAGNAAQEPTGYFPSVSPSSSVTQMRLGSGLRVSPSPIRREVLDRRGDRSRRRAGGHGHSEWISWKRIQNINTILADFLYLSFL